MRRLLVLLIAVVAALSVAGAVAFTASSGASNAQIARGTPSIHVSPNPSVADAPVTVTGHVPGVSGGHVTLWQKVFWQRHYHRLKTGNVDGSGHYSISLGHVDSKRHFYVTFRGVPSRVVHQHVEALITLTSSDPSPVPGENLTFSGHVTPRHPHKQIKLEQRVGNGWTVLARPRTDGHSNFSTTLSFPQNVNLVLRAELAGSDKNNRSLSPDLSLEVNVLHKIKHVVVIMQENRSFDTYFGSYPGAAGIPGVAGNPGTVPCETVASNTYCAQQTHNNANHGGPHGQGAALADYDGGKLDGFVAQSQGGTNCGSNPNDPGCSPCNGQNPSGCVDVMQYHDGSDIPNYWKYAHDFVLQDHMFEPNASWSEPQHLYQVSEWSAFCTSPSDPYSCTNQLQNPNSDAANNGITNGHILYAWTDLTWLLHKQNVSWGYYIMTGTEPDCEIDSQKSCTTKTQSYKTAGIWNPLPSFETVNQDGQEGNIQSLTNFYNAAKSGTLPAVSWIDPSGAVSEHPTSLVSAGQTYVTGLINAVMQSPDWNSTAIFVSWDDWGGFYDHVSPPGGLTGADANGYGLRVPGIVISPYAKQGYLDHQTLSHDAYNKFIEDAFLGGQRLDPKTDGRPDPRISVRETNPLLGDLSNDFDFNQAPRPPELLPVCPATQLTNPAPSC